MERNFESKFSSNHVGLTLTIIFILKNQIGPISKYLIHIVLKLIRECNLRFLSNHIAVFYICDYF